MQASGPVKIAYESLTFVGEVTLLLVDFFRRLFKRPFELQETIGQMAFIGAASVPIVALTTFSSGAVLSLSLRNPNDTSRFSAESATLTSLLTQYNISLPSKLPYATQPRVDVLVPPVLPNDAVTVQPQQ